MSRLSRAISVFLTVSFLTVTVGCGALGEQQTVENDDNQVDVNSITCMVWDRDNMPEGYTADDNTLANWIRAKVKDECGIDVHFVSVGRSTSDETIKKMVDENIAPDIVFTYSSSVFGYMTKQGKVADLTESLSKYGQNIEKYIGDIQYMGSYNDLQVAVMKRRGFKSPRHTAYIRKDWCDALGISVPKTKKELISYLYAVKEQNPGGVDGVIPWAMGGDVHSERFYQGFVGSYVENLSERDAFIYSERYMVVADGAVEGLRVLNKLYNDGIISLDFTADSDNSKYVADAEAGKVGFLVDDSASPFTYVSILKEKDPTIELDPILCFDLPGGGYRNVAEPDYGMYVMVPATSKDKTDAVVKYLNWLADPANAEMVNFTPDHEDTESGAAMTMSKEQLFSRGYSGAPGDYCIVNEHFDFVDDKEAQVSLWTENCGWETPDWFENYYDVCVTDQFTFPTCSSVLESEVKYQVDLDVALVEYAYNLICCPTSEFDRTQHEEYLRLLDLGLKEVLDERASSYDSGELRLGK